MTFEQNVRAVLDCHFSCVREELIDNAVKCIVDLKCEQEPKTGHWIHFASGDDCSECGWSTGKYISPSKYCPNCGIRMEG